MFQFTRPRGARPALVGEFGRALEVSIHAPTRGATPRVPPPRVRRAGFNSRAHEGRDPRGVVPLQGGDAVSIHAPTRGATDMTGRATRWARV